MWTDDETKSLRAMAHAGVNVRTMAGTLGKTRNAIIGKLHRLKVPVPNSLRDYVPRAKRPPPLKPRKRVLVPIELPETRPPMRRNPKSGSKCPEPLPVSGDLPAKTFKLAEWPDDGCRWVYEHPTKGLVNGCSCRRHKGLPYCDEHASRAYEASVVRDKSREAA